MATSRSSKSKKKNTVKIDFEGVEAGGGSIHIPDDNYLLEVVEVSQEESDSGNPYLSFKYKVAEGNFKGATVYDNCSLQPQALWRLRGMLEASGFEVPDSVYELDLDDLAGTQVFVQVENEEYDGKDRPRITAFLGEEAPEPATKPSKSTKETGKKSKAEPDPEPETGGKRKRKAKAIDVDSEVSFEDDGETYEGKVVSIDGKIATVEVDDDEWEIPIEELTLVE